MKWIILLLIFTACSFNIYSQPVATDSAQSPRVWGLAFGDYYYKSGGDSTGTQLQYTPYYKYFNAFDFRRIFFGIDYNISKKFFASAVLSYEGNTDSQGNRTVLVKDAYIRWKEIYSYANATFGIFATPGFSVASEIVWSYRSIEKTIMDMRSILSSRDFGLMLNGTFDKDMNYGYYLMVGDGSGLKPENTKFKKYYANFVFRLAKKKVIFDLYSDYEANYNDQSKTTFNGFLGYQGEKFTAGAEYFFQQQENYGTSATPGGQDLLPMGISVFVTGKLYEDKLKFFARYDNYNSNSNNDSTGFNQSFVSAGLDFMPVPKVHIMPNIWLNAYTAKEFQTMKLTSDVVPRLTIWYLYN